MITMEIMVIAGMYRLILFNIDGNTPQY